MSLHMRLVVKKIHRARANAAHYYSAGAACRAPRHLICRTRVNEFTEAAKPPPAKRGRERVIPCLLLPRSREIPEKKEESV